MAKMEIARVRAGMTVDEPVYVPGTTKLLVQHGIQLTPKMLVMLKYYGVKELVVSVPDTLFIGPDESLSWFLRNFFRDKINQIAPDFKEGNLNDIMFDISRRVLGVLEHITTDKSILELCVEIKLVNNKRLFYPSIHSCAHAVLLAGALGLSDQDIYAIAGAALLQNFGLCEMPHLVEQLDDLTDAQMEQWRQHSEYGYHFLRENGVQNDIAQLVYCHHELCNGKGFPRHLRGDEIPIGAKIINLCADFDELTFLRQMQPYEVAELFQKNADGRYDPRVVRAFLQNIPLYPLGSIARVSTGDVGVVVNIRKNTGARPVLRICYNRFNRPYTDTKVLDLADAPDVHITEILT